MEEMNVEWRVNAATFAQKGKKNLRREGRLLRLKGRLLQLKG
eukprot:CAMPEP_0196654656 /NCGR_PEP_ID=MMETSP1086-20130531/4387_1 /TAXON_ID=77921 /ORGANISM="Cyanoptyche  gloeocystis , Strain SAG4.97" /LENGTH=41 /DNA_ID= /DNA_START= /DNA_END= /DNA_ORIENTATION=